MRLQGHRQQEQISPLLCVIHRAQQALLTEQGSEVGPEAVLVLYL